MSTICRTLEVSRSNLYTQPPKDESSKRGKKLNNKEDDLLLDPIKEILKERPTYGYRCITIILRKKLGIAINHKKIYRIMKEHQLLLQRYDPKPLRVYDGKIITLRSNLRWCPDTLLSNAGTETESRLPLLKIAMIGKLFFGLLQAKA